MKTKSQCHLAGQIRPVHFEVTGLAAREVCLAGTFNDWHPSVSPMIDLGGGHWAKELTLPPGTYEYLLVADGRWIPDPGARAFVPNPFGGRNCLVAVKSD